MVYEGQCGYYPDRISRNHWISDPQHGFSPRQLTRILNKGYRRFAGEYYRPYCRGCRECTPYRIPVATFNPGRTQRRIRQRNAAVLAEWAAPQATQQKFELYVRYQLARHKDTGASLADMRRELAGSMLRQMYMNPPSTLELVIRENDTLLGFAIFDRTLDSLSAVYSVFEPDQPDRSLGTLNILLAIEKARAEGLPYLNLGLWLAGHSKMAYKQKFFPAEVYRGFRWRPLEKTDLPLSEG